jgi:plastocyanin
VFRVATFIPAYVLKLRKLKFSSLVMICRDKLRSCNLRTPQFKIIISTKTFLERKYFMNLKTTAMTALFGLLLSAFQPAMAAQDQNPNVGSDVDAQFTRTVDIPGADYFFPFVININRGDVVRFTNHDEDDHTVTSDPFYSSLRYSHINVLIPHETSAGPGVVRIRFSRPGTFTYYCRMHAHLSGGQPVNGGQEGNGIAGRPMMGVIIVR